MRELVAVLNIEVGYAPLHVVAHIHVGIGKDAWIGEIIEKVYLIAVVRQYSVQCPAQRWRPLLHLRCHGSE